MIRTFVHLKKKTVLIVIFELSDSMKTCNAFNEATEKKITESSKICLSKNTEMDTKISGKEFI